MKNRYWDAITAYMNDDIREQVHAELAPCTAKEFLERYLELDPDFQDLLDSEFYDGYIKAALLDRMYYFPNIDQEEAFFGSQMPICVDKKELEHLADGWGVDIEDLMKQVHEADPDEIESYGIYNAE